MSKLPKKVRKGVKEAESGGFAPIPANTYVLKIIEVDDEASGPAGPAWNIKFEVAKGKYKGRYLWRWCSLAENALWVLKEILDATGMDEDLDSDDLVGEKVLAAVSQGVIQKGERKGQTSNNIDRVMSVDTEIENGDDDGDDDDDDSSDDDDGDDVSDDDDTDDEEEEEEEKPKKKAKAKKTAKKSDDDFDF